MKEASLALHADCDAEERLFVWRLANPSVPIGLSCEGRRLVLERIATWDRFIRTHPYIQGDDFREYLYDLLNDFGPPPPGKTTCPPVLRRLATCEPSFVCETALPRVSSPAYVIRAYWPRDSCTIFGFLQKAGARHYSVGITRSLERSDGPFQYRRNATTRTVSARDAAP